MALSNLQKEALKGLVEFEKAYLNEVFGKTQLNATTNERSAATASYPGYLASAKAGLVLNRIAPPATSCSINSYVPSGR